MANFQSFRDSIITISPGLHEYSGRTGYLGAHLRQVIEWIENKSSVELIAICVGHDVSSIYHRSVTIADSEQLGDAMAYELVELLGNVPSAARHPFAINH